MVTSSTGAQRMLASGNYVDVLFSPNGATLYAVSATGVAAYNADTGILLGTYSFGVQLAGADLSADGTALLVADQATTNGVAYFYRLNLSDGHVDTFSDASGSITGFDDVAFLTATTALAIPHQRATNVTVRDYDLSTGSYVADGSGSSPTITASADHSRVLVGFGLGALQANTYLPNGSIAASASGSYDPYAGASLPPPFVRGQAISGNGSLVALAGFVDQHGLSLGTSSFAYQPSPAIDAPFLGSNSAPLAFSADGHTLYEAMGQSIIAIDVATSKAIGTYALQAALPVAQGGNGGASNGFGNTITASGDGHYLAVREASAIELIDLTSATFASGTGADTLSGPGPLFGLDGNDTLTSGSDRMYGGAGNDTYNVTDFGAMPVEYAGQGTDTVISSVNYTLPDQTENLVLTGTAFFGYGNQLDNHITGNNGGDTLSGSYGNDTITGGTGNDTIDGGPGNNVLIGGGGTDTVTYANSFESVQVHWLHSTDSSGAAVESDDAQSASRHDELQGFSKLVGSFADDLFEISRRGADIDGGGGVDTAVVSGEQNGGYTTRISGVSGTATVTTAANASYPSGQPAAIAPYSVTMRNVAFLTVSAALVDASGFSSLSTHLTFLDTAGDQRFLGSHGDDVFGHNSDGSDAGGADYLTGNGGSDVYDYGNALTNVNGDHITDFASDDRISFAAADSSHPVPTFIGTAAFSGVAWQMRYENVGGTTLVEIDNNGDGRTDQTLTIDNGAFQLKETAAESHVLQIASDGQVLVGSDGNDQLEGGASDDTISGGAGSDTLIGDGGNDGFSMGAFLDPADRIDGGAGGNDQVGLDGDYSGAHRLVLADATVTGVEVIAALPGHSYDLTTADGNVAAGQNMAIYGAQLGTGDSLTFNGSAESDGNFTVYGGSGVDTLTGGAGNDGFRFGPGTWGASDVVHGGGGANDQLALDGNYAITIDGRMDVEVVALLPGPAGDLDHYDLTIADDFVPAGGSRTIYGAQVTTDIRIDASAEHDGSLTVYAGQGNDTIAGGAGNDTLFGNAGADSLRGGAGADVFVYDSATQSSGTGFDTLADFQYGTDTIRITGETHDVFTSVSAGRLDAGSFDADLATAVGGQLHDGSAVYFTATSGSFAGQTFLIVDEGGSGYAAGTDYVIHLPSAPPTPTADIVTA